MKEFIYRMLVKVLHSKEHSVIRLRWQKAALESLLKRKDRMSPEEFLREYNRIGI